MENYKVESPIERSVNNEVNALVGNNDVNLKTIVKLAIMTAKKQEPAELHEIIQKIKECNVYEAGLVYEEYELLPEFVGEQIFLYNKPDERKTSEEDTGCKLSKSE